MDKIRTLTLMGTCAIWALAPAAQAGPYTDSGLPDTAIAAWAGAVDDLVRGPIDIATPAGPLASFGAPANALGAASSDPADVVSLGDGGSITLFFPTPIHNGPGDDLAVFENGFFDLFGLFAELAYVEVGTNGLDFVAFETHTVRTLPVSSFESLDPTDYDGLAGRHPQLLGTGFDLSDVVVDPMVQNGAVDVNAIHYVRLTDVIGDGSTFDDFGNPLYDPYATAFASGGFDVDAVGALYVPEPALPVVLLVGLIGFAVCSRRRLVATTLAAAFLGASPAMSLVATFDDLTLAPDGFENGSGLAGGFSSGGIDFDNNYFASYDGFSAFAYSNTTDTVTPGFGNQFSNITGSGVGGSENFGVFFDTFGFGPGSVRFTSAQSVLGAWFTNTTYAYYSIRDGDSFAEAFGGTTGDDPDRHSVFIQGRDAAGGLTGEVEFRLADYTFADNALDYIVDEWTWVDLSPLGVVSELTFRFDSTDPGTPVYFAIDDLTTIPEPGTALLLGIGLVALASRRPIDG